MRLSDTGVFSVSPDGRHVVFAGTGADSVLRLWIRALDTLETKPLAGTEGEVAANTPPMIWSPDGRDIAFYADGKLKKIGRSGGEPQTLCDIPGTGIAVGGSWNRDDVIVVGNATGGLRQCPARGGTATAVTVVDASEGTVGHLFP